MLRPGLVLIPLLALALLAGCSQRRPPRTASDLEAAGHSAGQAVRDVGRDANVKKAEADLRAAGHDAGSDLHKAAAEAKSAANTLEGAARHAGRDFNPPKHDDKS